MAVNREVFELQYRTEGMAAVQRARDELARLEKQIAAATQYFRTAGTQGKHYAATMEHLGAKLAEARAKVDAFERVAAGGGKGMKNFGMAALEAGRAIEDFAYAGLQGAMNNIPQLAMFLGGGAGLTAAVAILGAAAITLTRNWDTLMDALGHTSPIENATQEMERLEQATARTADQEARYQQLKRAQAAGEAQAGATTPDQEIQAKAVREVIAAAPQQAIVAGLTIAGGELLDTPEIRRLREEAAAEQAAAESLQVLNTGKATAALPGVLAGRARELLGLAETDPGTLRQITEVIERNPGTFPEGLAGQLREAGQAPGRERRGRIAEAASEFWGELTDAVGEHATRKAKQAGFLGRIASALDFGFGKADQLSPEEQARRDRQGRPSGGEFGPDRETMERGLAEERAERRADRDDRFALARMRLGLMEGVMSPRAPSAIAAESFVGQVQSSGARNPIDLMKQQLDRAEMIHKAIETQTRILERRGVIGP